MDPRPTQVQPSSTVRERLLSLTLRPRRIHGDPRVLVPGSLRPFSTAELFAPPDEGSGEPEGRRILELGSGWGEFALGWLQAHPGDRYLAIEAKSDRVGRALRGADRLGVRGLRFLVLNFSWFLEEFLPPFAFDLIIINFPDPWPKRRHWKHRLIRGGFPARAENLLRPGGVVHIATDYGPYARRILSIFRRAPQFEAIYDFPNYVRTRPPGFPPTRFETIHLAEGRTPYYQGWQLRSGPVTP